MALALCAEIRIDEAACNCRSLRFFPSVNNERGILSCGGELNFLRSEPENTAAVRLL